MSGTAVSIVVALIAAAGSCIGAVVSSISTRNTLLQKMELQQAVQNERVEAYQRNTNEKLEQLSTAVAAQAAYGTKIAVIEAKIAQLEKERAV